MTVNVCLQSEHPLSIDKKEALRYLGYAGHEPGENVKALMDACEQEILAAAQPRSCYARFPVAFPAPFAVDFGFGTVESVSLARHLSGCHSVFIMAATLGIGIDRLIAKYSRISPSRGAVIDAMGSSAIECWCDAVEKELTKGQEKHCQRFSPGYGDFSLHYQKDFFQCLDITKNIGVALSQSLMMTPVKSVTAVVGLGASARTCGNKCMFCSKDDCIYREVLQ